MVGWLSNFLGILKPATTIAVRVENLKQCLDPEENDLNNFTFSTEDKYLKDNDQSTKLESYRPDTKYIDLWSTNNIAKDKMFHSKSESKLKSFTKNASFGKSSCKKAVLNTDTFWSELNLNLNFGSYDFRQESDEKPKVNIGNEVR